MARPEVKKKRRQLAEAAAKSRKERKRLEKVVLRKKHKVDRSNILAELKRVQLAPDQLDQLHSTTSMQTKGLKRFVDHDDDQNRPNLTNGLGTAEQCPNANFLIRRKRRKTRGPIQPSCDSSSSEDTDAISTDTEAYDDEKSKVNPPKEETQLDSMKPEVAYRTCSSTDEDSISPQNPSKSSEPEETPEIVSNPNNTEERPAKVRSQIREPAVFVQVYRDEEIEKTRSELPIIGEEQRIMEEIRYNDVVIISGETGSGKTTQLPQFLYEAGYTLNGRMIGITEPRRVAAVTMSERVSRELNLNNNEVAYQIRFEGNVSQNSFIKFMTDGVLLKECQHDFLLTRYSVLIIDEAHERSVHSDILIGLLSRIVPLRARKEMPLKLIIMSATLRVSDFTENKLLFPKVPPIINIEARQYPVTVHFAKRTPDNYLEAAYKKIKVIHDKMPKGGLLVFITSQNDVKALCNRLKKRPMLHCLGLYAMLPIEKQQQVFRKPPEGSRLCVIATNVAETSITIPNIKYVIDTGMEKRKVYNLITGVSRFITTWTSKSSAEQRTGRAGRMGPGHCYRLYSSAVFTNDFSDFSEPQILQKPIEDVLLQMKTMNIDNVVNFPFPSRPSVEAIKAAEKKLILLGALDNSKSEGIGIVNRSKTEYASRPTSLGRLMAKFSVSARCSKMIALAPSQLLPHVICLVSALTVREMFINDDKFKNLRKKWAGQCGYKKLGDFMVMLKSVIKYEISECPNKFCAESGLRPKAMLEIDRLRDRLTKDAKKNLGLERVCKLRKPSEKQCSVLRQLLLTSFCDQIAKKLSDGELANKSSKLDPNQGVTKRRIKNAYQCKDMDEPVYIGSESVLRGQHPEYVIYKELYQGDKKIYMRDVAVVEPEWLNFIGIK